MISAEPQSLTPPDQDGSSLGQKVAKGTALITAARFIIRLIGLINTIILARLLLPDAFGVVAIGIMIMQLLQNFTDIGVSQTVIKYGREDRSFLDTLFTIGLCRGLLVGGVIALLAPLAGDFYQDDRVTIVFFAMAAVVLMNSLTNPRYFEFERDLDYSREFIISTLSKLTNMVVSVWIALVTGSYLAIVVGLIAGALVQFLGSYMVKPYRPRWSLASIKELWGFLGWVTGVSALVAISNKSDPLILGRVTGMSTTGTFYMGDQLAYLPTMELATPLARAMFPGLSTLEGDKAKMREAYLRGVLALAVMALPAAVGFAFVAQDAVLFILGEEWADTVPVIQVLAPIFGVMSLYVPMHSYAMAAGYQKQMFFRELIYLAVKLPTFIAGAVLAGLNGVLIALLCNGIFYILLQARLYAQITGGNAFEPMLVARRSLAGIAAMALYFWILRPMVPIDQLHILARLTLDIFLGASAFILTQSILWQMAGRPDGIERDILGFLAGLKHRLPGSTS